MKIVGNGRSATVLILIFITILCFLSYRCSAADHEVDLFVGSSFATAKAAPVIGLNVEFPQTKNTSFYAGTYLWGSTSKANTNWDWHVGYRTCRNRFCANIGATYVQTIDDLNGSHANFNLGLSYLIDWKRISRFDFFHISNAGTTIPNLGRNAAGFDLKLQ